MTRRSSITKSSLYFSVFLIVSFSTTVTDIVSSYTISFPEKYSSAFNYTFSLWYLFSFMAGYLLLVLYMDSLAKISAIEKPIHLIIRALVIYELIINVTSPWTHLVIYFDENGKYIHGPLFYVNYAVGVVAMLTSIIILQKGRVKFSIYQRQIFILFSIGLLVSNLIQVIRPDILLGGFDMAILSIFLYIAFENPSYFFYKDTHCQNREAFFRTMKLRNKSGEKTSIVLGVINEYDEIAKLLRATQKDNLFRWIADKLSIRFKRNAFLLGGNHFAVILKGGTDDLSGEKEIEKQISDIFEERVNLSDRTIVVSVCTAILPSKYHFRTTDELEGVIDIMIAKVGEDVGDDAYERVEKAIATKHRFEELQRVVEKAMANDGFMVYYQPILNVKTGKFESAEALVRLIDSEIGFVSPEEFIPVTEKAGLILPLGEIIFRKVCTFLNNIDVDALGLKYVEVNLSPLQCEKRDISEKMFGIMDECHTDPHMINFEITETAEAEFVEGSPIVENIIDMEKRGVSFSIDDFGSGFSAMDHLFQVPINLVKVDKSILWQAMENKNAMIVLKNTFNMVRELNKEILVEGVETQEMVDVLKENGCNFMQGYFFSKPIPEDEFVEFLKTRNIA